MEVVRWTREQAVAWPDPLRLDSLDDVGVLVLHGVGEADDDRLRWCERAPCVVVGISDAAPASQAADLALSGPTAEDELDRIVAAVAARPAAARTLVEVLRTLGGLDTTRALRVESLAYSVLLAGPEFASWRAAQPVREPPSFAHAPVRIERDDATMRVVLARPENRNAFSAPMRDALFEALAAAEVDPTVDRVVLSGDGPCFSSGGDLVEFGTSTDVGRAHQIRTLRSIGAVLARLDAEVVAEVHGPCVGAGLELAGFASRVVARRDTTFLLPEVSMGLIPGAGGTVSISRRAGRQQAARLAILGERIGVEAALELGLVDEIVD